MLDNSITKTAVIKKLRIVAPAILLAFVLTACGSQAASQGGGDERNRSSVVASNSVVADLVENVGGEEVEVTTLVGPNEDVHNFEPSPAATRSLAEANVVFENGLQLEPWMDDLYESSGTAAQRVQVGEAEGIELLSAGEDEQGPGGEGDHEEEHSEDEHGHDHAHGEYDPHVWHDPQNAVAMVSEIKAALSEADSGNADTYKRNAQQYISELEDLDAEVEEMVAGIPEEDRKLVTAHNTFGYYAEAYGFEIIGTSLESFSTEASDPSAGETAALADEIQETGVPAIFPENVSNEAVMERIASESGAKLAPPLYTDALGDPGGEAGTYVEMLRYNSQTISEALS